MGNPEKSPPLRRKRPRPLLTTYHASFSFFLVFVASGAPEIKLHSYVKFQAIKRCVTDTENGCQNESTRSCSLKETTCLRVRPCGFPREKKLFWGLISPPSPPTRPLERDTGLGFYRNGVWQAQNHILEGTTF